jgi:Contractile injection system spike tip protein
MLDLILVDGDVVNFMPNFGPVIVVVQPTTIKGSGPAAIGGKRICVDGDEKSVSVPGCIYMTPQFSIPGTGTLQILALAAFQTAKKARVGGRPVLLKGAAFTAKFEVQAPAQQPPPGPGSPIPDATPFYTGSGTFITTNIKCRGS